MEAIVQPISWADWPEDARSIFQGFRSKEGEMMVLENNLFVERVLPGAILRKLSKEGMAAYHAPFVNAGEDRANAHVAGKPGSIEIGEVVSCEDFQFCIGSHSCRAQLRRLRISA